MVSGGTARKVSLHISKILAYGRNICPLAHPRVSPTPRHSSPGVGGGASFLTYSRFLACVLALAGAHPPAEVALVFVNDVSSGSSSDDEFFTT
jgi:hypothetical protein